MHNKTRSQRDMSHAVLFATGPWLLRDAFKAATGEPGQLAVGYAGEHKVRGTRIMVYSLGQWCARPPTLLTWLTQQGQHNAGVAPLSDSSHCTGAWRRKLQSSCISAGRHADVVL